MLQYTGMQFKLNNAQDLQDLHRRKFSAIWNTIIGLKANGESGRKYAIQSAKQHISDWLPGVTKWANSEGYIGSHDVKQGWGTSSPRETTNPIML